MTAIETHRSPVVRVLRSCDDLTYDAMRWTGSNWPSIVAFTGGCDMRGGKVYVGACPIGAVPGDWLVAGLSGCHVVRVVEFQGFYRVLTDEDAPAPADEPGPFDEDEIGRPFDADDGPLVCVEHNAASTAPTARLDWEIAFAEAYPALGQMSGFQIERALRTEFSAAFEESRHAAELLRKAHTVLSVLGESPLATEIRNYLKGKN